MCGSGYYGQFKKKVILCTICFSEIIKTLDQTLNWALGLFHSFVYFGKTNILLQLHRWHFNDVHLQICVQQVAGLSFIKLLCSLAGPCQSPKH